MEPAGGPGALVRPDEDQRRRRFARSSGKRKVNAMSVVVLSVDPACPGVEIAERTARELGYTFLARQVLESAARDYRVPEEKLEEALREPPSLLNRFSGTRAQHLAYFHASLAGALKPGDVVYCGEVGHMFVSGVSHILKVMLTATLEDRVKWKTQSEKIPEKKARELLEREAEDRRKWYQAAFGQDGSAPDRFDIVINLSQIEPDRAVKMLVDMARDVKYQPITYSVKAMEDEALSSRVRARLVTLYSDVSVRARDGEVRIQARALRKEKKPKVLALRKEVEEMDGVQYVEIEG